MRSLSLVVAVAVLSFASPVRADDLLATDRPAQARLTPCPEAAVPELAAQSPTPVYRRWYFWAAIAGTVAAAVTVGVVMASSRKPPLTEAEICVRGGCDACIGLGCVR